MHLAPLIATAADEAPTAGGAAFDEIIIAAGMAAVVMAFFAWVVLRERMGRPTFVSRLADWMAAKSDLPRWAALPIVLCSLSILSAGFGVWWDVPIHMQNGRDEGPLANPSHYPIFLGILGFTHAGILSIGLARDPLPRRTLKLAPNWRVPMGALVITAAGFIALVGFPADDLWHRLFGQDVTEWGPTHVMMIGGAVTCVLGFPLLLAESAQVGAPGTRGLLGRLIGGVALCICGIPFAFLMEFDLGVPQFPAATQFLIFAFLATWICSAVRIWLGPGGALLAAALYWLAHVFLFASVWLLPEVLTARFLLLIPSAIIVELVGLAMKPRIDHKAVPFALVSGLLVGSVGMYAEWWWTKFFMPPPQPFAADTLPFLLAVSTVAAIGGGLTACWIVSRISTVAATTEPEPAQTHDKRWFGLAGLAIFALLMGIFGVPRSATEYEATITYDEVTGGASECVGDTLCEAEVTVTFADPEAATDAIWFYGLAWQGRPKGAPGDTPRDPATGAAGIVRTELEPTGEPGQYRTEHPLPLYGPWKTLLRLHLAPNTLIALPLYAPDDPAITSDRGRQVTVANGETITTTGEHEFLQREARDDVPKWLWTVAYTAVIATWLALLLFYGWCYNNAARPSVGRAQREKAPL